MVDLCPGLEQKGVTHIIVVGHSFFYELSQFSAFSPQALRFVSVAPLAWGVVVVVVEQWLHHFLPLHQESVFHYNSPSRHCQMLSLSCSKLKTGVRSGIHF